MSAHSALTRLFADRFALVCAIWLHLVLYALLGEASLWRLPSPAPALPVEVEIVAAPSNVRPAPPPSSGLTVPAAPSPGADAEALPETAATGPGARTPPAKDWVTATSLLATDVLNDPRSAEAREMLGTLTGADIRDQLCGLEAMEQVRKDRPGFRPTRLAPHAFRNAVYRDGLVEVRAGALRSNRIWYEIAYRCRLSADGSAIGSFEYALGDEIDRALWDEHGLAPEF